MTHLALRFVVWSLAFLVTLEVCARFDDRISYGAPLVGPYDAETLYTFDSLGKTGKPGAQYLKWKLNSYGLRGPDPHPDRVRVMCLGSSETFGLYEQEDGEWPRQLEHILNQRAGRPAFDVVNAAYPGMSLSTTLKRLPNWLDELQPKVVVVYPSLASYIWLPALAASPASPPKPALFQLRIAGRVETLLKTTLPDWVQDRIRSFQTQRAARGYPVMSRLPEENVVRFRQDLERVVGMAKASGADVTLLTHATLFGDEVRPEYRSVLRTWRKFYPMLAEEGFLDMERRLNAVIRETARNQGVLLVDAARQIPGGHKNFVEFVHFTDEGAKTLARLVADHIDPRLRREDWADVRTVNLR